ncbi:GH10543 [Drosophila grimshawi]|uniref:GH10543 n=1 Tax=Drosophila grimshawi TaxID=7222 RepID=B4JDJ7_DROGR|nr:GH10543 [Drosophila grimshawi]
MSLTCEHCSRIAIYRISYKLWVPDVKSLMPRAAQKANELNVSGYMSIMQCGNAVSGEFEGTLDKLNLMMAWLEQEIPEDCDVPQFGAEQLQLKPGYDEFFCC